MSVDHGEQTIPQDGSKLRVEEVEEALYLHPAVRECVVMEVSNQINREEFISFAALQAELTGREQELESGSATRSPTTQFPNVS
jgi:acyl-coenzyme A synthetase/AMP-(fatty) acid ligase